MDGFRQSRAALRSEMELLRRRVEQLEESGEQYCELVEGIILYSGQLLSANPAAARIFGYDSPVELLSRAHFHQLWAPHERSRLQRFESPHLAEEETPATFEAQAVRSDGALIWLHTYVRKLRWDGRTVSQCSFIDISQRKRAEQELRNSQRLLHLVIDTVSDVIGVKDASGRHVVVNKAMAEHCGTTPERLIGLSTEQLPGLDEREKKLLLGMDKQVLEAKQPMEFAEVEFRGPEGRQGWRHLVKLPLHDDEGNIIGIVGISQDVTGRRQAEAEISRLAAAVEQAGDAIFVTDLDGTIQYVNPAFERITGFTREEAIGQTPRILKSGKHDQAFYAALWETMKHGEVWKGRFTNQKKDGTLYETYSTHSPIRNSQGQVVHYVCVQKDITQQVQIEDQLRRAQRLESLGTLAGGIAHDFNNILMPIMGFAEILLEEVPPESPQQAWLKIIHEASHRGKDLISQILLFSRRTDSHKKSVPLKPMVLEVSRFLKSTLPRTIVIHEIVRDEGMTNADPSQVHRVVMNLCVNAAQAMPNGGELTLSLDRVHLDECECYLGQTLSGPHVRLCVADTGVGMDEEVLAHIFEPFFTTKSVGDGTGLGLSTVYGIVQDHGGGIRVTSRPGHGTAFDVFFPAMEPAQNRTGVTAADLPGGGNSILFIDDEQSIADLGREALQRLGYRVTALTDGITALEIFRADPGRFDLVVTDQTMPDITGDQLTREFRSIRPDIPIILCTGYSESITPERASALGINEFAYKPVGASSLGRLVRAVLDRKG